MDIENIWNDDKVEFILIKIKLMLGSTIKFNVVVVPALSVVVETKLLTVDEAIL